MDIDPAKLESRLALMLDSLLSHWPLPGGVVAIVDNNALTLVHPFGYADLGARILVQPEHLFEIGSISKLFTSLVINQLIDEGAFELDTPIVSLMPWVVLPRGAGEITVRHLLNHTAGLVAGLDAVPDDVAQLWSMRDTEATPVAEFFHYSNLGFVLLGRLVTEVTGQSLADAVRTRLLGPSGMLHTLAEITNADRPSLAVGYAQAMDDSPWLPGQPLVPATWLEASAGDGNIASDAADMARFLRLLLGGGKLDGEGVVSTGSFARIIDNLAPEGEETLCVGSHERVLTSRYGLGVNVEDTASSRLLTHGGGMVGYASFLLADIGRGLGVVVLTNANGDTPIAELIARAVHAELLGPAVEATELAEPTDLDPAIWGERAELAGQFYSATSAISLEFTAHRELVLVSGGERGRVLRTLQDRCACEHPDFSLFHLRFEDGDDGLAWVYGDQSFRRKQGATTNERGSSVLEEFEGHYRSHSPWFTNFRVFARSGRLYLAAAGGVEAPSSEQELVQLSPGRFRIGADERLPERLSFGPVVEGHSVWASRDGCVYSRTFTG